MSERETTPKLHSLAMQHWCAQHVDDSGLREGEALELPQYHTDLVVHPRGRRIVRVADGERHGIRDRLCDLRHIHGCARAPSASAGQLRHTRTGFASHQRRGRGGLCACAHALPSLELNMPC